MMTRSRLRVLGAVIGFAVLLAACGAETADETTTVETQEDQAATSTTAEMVDEDAVLVPEGDLTFKFGTSSSLEPFNLPAAITAERLNENGWNVEWVEHAQTHLNSQSLAQGSVQWSVTRHVEPIRLFATGEEQIRFIYENTGRDYGIIIPADITCEEMDGKRFGIHGEAATASLIAVNYLERECGADMEILVIPGGENRIVALQAGELDGTSVAFEDFLILDDEAPGEYQLLDTGDTFAVAGAGWWSNVDWIEENRDVAVAWVAENLKTHRMIHEDPELYLDAWARLIPEHDYPGFERQIYDLFIENGAWPVNGGDPSAMQAAIPVFAEFGELDPALEERADDMVYGDILEEALEIVGIVEGAP